MTRQSDKWRIKHLPNKDFVVEQEEDKPQDKREKDVEDEDMRDYCSPDSPTAD